MYRKFIFRRRTIVLKMVFISKDQTFSGGLLTSQNEKIVDTARSLMIKNGRGIFQYTPEGQNVTYEYYL